MPKVKITKGLKGKNLVSVDDLTPQMVLKLLNSASHFSKNPNSDSLKDKIVALLFFEPSSRTFSSFSVAVKRLGGQTLEYQNPSQTSSLVKGETFEDMIKVFSEYCDAIVLRHYEKGSALKASEVSSVPVINAGDGIGEHPTQALLDLLTISQIHKRVENLKGLIVGDLVNGRTVHSLIKLLAKFRNNQVWLLSVKEFAIPQKDLEEYRNRGISINLIHEESDIPKDLDFWYWTRMQTERLKSKKAKNAFILRKNLIDKYAGESTIFMHPLPRVGEILEEVDLDPRAMYLTQEVQNGVFMRMAILDAILK